MLLLRRPRRGPDALSEPITASIRVKVPGLTEFFQAEQTLPVSGRLKLLREAGASSVLATEAEAAFSLWQARTQSAASLLPAARPQKREAVYSTSLKDIDDVIRVLREREIQGEGSKFDRLRTERERAELLAELALLRSRLRWTALKCSPSCRPMYRGRWRVSGELFDATV